MLRQVLRGRRVFGLLLGARRGELRGVRPLQEGRRGEEEARVWKLGRHPRGGGAG